MHKEAIKSKAIETLAYYWRIKQSEIMALGGDIKEMTV